MDNSHLDHTALPPGTRLYYGKYVISSKIGQGGFGITYKAVQQGLNRAVCIKEYYIEGRCARDFHSHSVRPQNISEEVYEKYRQSFVKESQTLASLHYTGIVEVIDIFDENNTSYMVMPFIEGRTLQDIVDSNGPLKYPEAVNYMAQVANAVGYIHEHHILHRDIKPGNIMITADYKAVLIDFGSAREYVEDKTQSHTSMLTHGYAPPEQYSRTSRKGSYTDIYALGATLYFILTGRVPVEAAARLTEDMPEPRQLNPNIPAEANRTIMKAMQIKPQDRHQSIREFMADLQNGSPSSFAKPMTTTPPKTRKRNRLPMVMVIGIVVLLVILGMVMLLKPKQNGADDVKQQEPVEIESESIPGSPTPVPPQEFTDSIRLVEIYRELKMIQDSVNRFVYEKNLLEKEKEKINVRDKGRYIELDELLRQNQYKIEEIVKRRASLIKEKEVIEARMKKNGNLLNQNHNERTQALIEEAERKTAEAERLQKELKKVQDSLYRINREKNVVETNSKTLDREFNETMKGADVKHVAVYMTYKSLVDRKLIYINNVLYDSFYCHLENKDFFEYHYARINAIKTCFNKNTDKRKEILTILKTAILNEPK